MMKVKFLMLTLFTFLMQLAAYSQGIENVTSMKYEGITYLLSKPLNYSEAQNHPAIIFLHGGDGSNTKHHPSKYAAKAGINFPFVVIAPSCTGGCSWSGVDLEGILEQTSKVAKIDPNRVYLIGYSLGGAGTWANLKKSHHLIAAASPLAPAGGFSTDLCLAKDLPIRVYHGTADGGYRNSRMMVDKLKECGSKNVELISLEGKGHGIWPDILSDQSFYDWLLSKSR